MNLVLPPVPRPEAKPPRSIQWPFGVILFGAALFSLGYCAATVNAAEHPTDRPWVVWNEGANEPWISAKGHQATNTSATACNLSLHEASKAMPSGSRLSCRRINQGARP